MGERVQPRIRYGPRHRRLAAEALREIERARLDQVRGPRPFAGGRPDEWLRLTSAADGADLDREP